jgi:2-polyprenyl-3-methyl-5-hydroxy-6-metoxy-1,4-benzoquinol methylase
LGAAYCVRKHQSFRGLCPHHRHGIEASRDSLLNDLEQVFRLKYGDDPLALDWGPRIRWRFGYFSPDEHYEAVVNRLVIPGCDWLDVGCGRNIFPSNRPLAKLLAQRCALLVGVDPDETINDNDLVHERVRQSIEDYHTSRTFDLVTLRMAAEHVADPGRTLTTLARLTRRGGKVVIYTVNRWSPVPILTWLVPFQLHHLPKRVLWRTDPKDTFPVAYRMNTRKTLRRLFEEHGFSESEFRYLDDCRTLMRFRATLILELSLWRCLRALWLTYPENCLLGVYERGGS